LVLFFLIPAVEVNHNSSNFQSVIKDFMSTAIAKDIKILRVTYFADIAVSQLMISRVGQFLKVGQ